jgi:hypothetical protein
MIHSKYPEELPNVNISNSIFLAGETHMSGWQTYVIDELFGTDLIIFDPRVIVESNIEGQIDWERKRIEYSNIILFWFAQNSVNPTMFFEFCDVLAKGVKKVFVGCHPLYSYKNEVMIHAKHISPKLYVYNRLDEMVINIKEFVTLNTTR